MKTETDTCRQFVVPKLQGVDPKDKDFSPSGEARHKIENGVIVTSLEMYFSTYQAIASGEHRSGLYQGFSPDFFDLMLIYRAFNTKAADESTTPKKMRATE